MLDIMGFCNVKQWLLMFGVLNGQQVGGASSLPAIEQSQAMVRLQDMCPGQIQYELAGSGCLGSSGQRDAGNIPWCVCHFFQLGPGLVCKTH